MSSPTTLLPFQPATMSTAQLAAVSYLARYSGRTHALYAYQLRRWFALVRDQRTGPAGRDPARPRRALHPPARRVRADGLLGGDDDARRARVTSGSPTSTASSRRPRRLRPAAEGAPRRVPHPGPGPARADPVPPGRPDHHRPPRRAGLPARASTPCARRRPPRCGSRTTPRPCAGTGCCTWSARATSPPPCR